MASNLNRVIVVLGMHRSGTSTLTRALTALGVELGDRLLPPAAGNNDKGFFEDRDINDLNIEMLAAIGSDWHCLAPVEPRDLEVLKQTGFFLKAVDLLRKKTSGASIFAFKDPRVPKLLNFWQSVFEYCNLRVGYVIVIRNPLSVARSLMTRDALPYEKSYHLWYEHVLTGMAFTVGHPRTVVDYDQFLLAPERYLQVAAKRLALTVDAAKYNEYEKQFLDSGLRHSVYEDNDLVLDSRCPAAVRSLYSELQGIAGNNVILDDPTSQSKHALALDQFHKGPLNLRWIDGVLGAYGDLVGRTSSGFVNQDVVDQFHKTAAALIRIDVDIFRQIFDAPWYLQKYPDVAAAGIDPYLHFVKSGHLEKRLPCEKPFGSLLDALIRQLDAYSSRRIDAQLLADERLALLNDKERSFKEQLQELKVTHVEAQLHLKEEFAFREQLLTRRCEELSAREAALAGQLHDHRKAADSEHAGLVNAYGELEKRHLMQLEKARQQFEQTLSELNAVHAREMSEHQRKAEGELADMAKRELAEIDRRDKAMTRQVQELRSTGERERAELKRQHADREKSQLMQLEQERERLSATIAEFSTKEAHYRQRLVAHEVCSEQEKAELRQRLLDRTVFSIIGAGIRNVFRPSIPAGNRVGDRQGRSDGAPGDADGQGGEMGDRIGQHGSGSPDQLSILLAMTGEEFLQAAYQSVLGRPADLGGLQHYMARLEAGESKSSILEDLRGSAEGTANRAAWEGLARGEPDTPTPARIGIRQSQ